jgi:transcriptional regulator with GAF, ATPase, and Fis domain/serine/threonine protein kinase
MEKIAGGRLFDSWHAVEEQSGQHLFVKRPSRVGGAQASEKARKSFTVLRELQHPSILQPVTLHQEQGGAFLLYPYLSPDLREVLSTASFEQSYPWLIPRICSLLDFIHCRGYVHCDVKASNFLLLKNDPRPRLFLTDFDFVTEVGTRLNKIIFGAPGHIAPEIFYDDIVLTQSDHYSFGVMLLKLIANNSTLLNDLSAVDSSARPTQISLTEDDVMPEFKRLVPFVSALLAWDASERPSYLGQLLRVNSSIFATDEKRYDVKLIWSVARSIVRSPVEPSGEENASLSDFVQNQLKLVGAPDEVLLDAENGLTRGPFQVLRSLLSLMVRTKISRIGEYWFVNVYPDDVFEFYRSSWSPLRLEKHGDSSPQVARDERIRKVLRLKVRKSNWKSLLLAESMLQETSIPPSDDLGECGQLLHIRAGQLSRKCGLIPRSDEHFEKALESGSLSVRKRIGILLLLADPNLIGRDPVRFMKYVMEARYLARKNGLLHERIIALRRKFTYAISRGKLRALLPRLGAAVKITKRPGLEEDYSSVCNQLGIVLKDLGRLEEAKSALLEGVRAVTASGSIMKPVSLYSNLAEVQFQLGDYGESIESAGTALRLLRENLDNTKSTYARRALASCYTIAADYDQADLNALKLLEARIRARYVLGFGEYYLKSGWIDQRRGDYDRSYVHLKNALRIFIAADKKEYISRAKYYLGVLSFWRGKFDEAERLAGEAKKAFTELEDKVSESDARLLLLRIAAAAKGGTTDATAVVQVLQTFTKVRNYLGSMSCLLHLATFGYYEEAMEFLGRNEELRKNIEGSDFPLANGLKHLLTYWSSQREERTGDAIAALKKCYQVFDAAHLYYDVAAISGLIARHYDSLDNPRLAIDYLQAAEKFAYRLGNEPMVRSLRDRIGALKRRAAARRPEREMLVEISELLNSVEDYKVVQAKLLRYAINATGAERGVLLLLDSLTGRLRVEASYDCDRQSISDIEEISNTIVDLVQTSHDPYLIDDATKHRATRDRKSIIQHNILSIVAIPLLSRGELIGVLYLDHHILTGKFTEEDHLTIKAVGDLIAVALKLSGIIRNLEARAKESEAELRKHGIRTYIVTQDRGMLDLLDKIPSVANSPLSIHLYGESGTGKELLARMIHEQSGRSSGPYLAINCAEQYGEIGLASQAGVSEGAATGVKEREGFFEAADGGTLFLDEIGDMPLGIQGGLLRILDQHEVRRLGSSFTKQVDFRLVTASNKKLADLVEEGTFRDDLYYRITDVQLEIPPLRERFGDVPLLVEHFISASAEGRSVEVSREAMAYLRSYSWPGNVRELRSVVLGMVALASDGVIEVSHLPEKVVKEGKRVARKLKESLEKTEEKEIVDAMAKFNGNQSAAARAVGMSLTTFRRRLRKYGIDPDEYKTG